eukprot:6664790-Alexandrium_andersonii.AAC.1
MRVGRGLQASGSRSGADAAWPGRLVPTSVQMLGAPGGLVRQRLPRSWSPPRGHGAAQGAQAPDGSH